MRVRCHRAHRGTATGLATTSSELANYRVEEGAFWGNLFIDLGDVEVFYPTMAISRFACVRGGMASGAPTSPRAA